MSYTVDMKDRFHVKFAVAMATESGKVLKLRIDAMPDIRLERANSGSVRKYLTISTWQDDFDCIKNTSFDYVVTIKVTGAYERKT